MHRVSLRDRWDSRWANYGALSAKQRGHRGCCRGHRPNGARKCL